MTRRKNIIDILSKYEQDLKKLVSIPSVLDDSSTSYLFGKDIQLALEATIEIAKHLGFETYIDPEGYYGYAQIGSGEQLFGVLGHIDVVPVGDISKWKSHPFEMLSDDTHYYGRGVSDDKGPLLAAMYALKLMLDEGFIPTQKIRFIFGTDEETLWRCMSKYTELEIMPDMGFSPDSNFPLIFAEKALVQVKLSTTQNIDFSFTGGNAFNTVPESALIKVENSILRRLDDMHYPYRVNENTIEVIGIPKHAQSCDQGVNAIARLAQAIEPLHVSSTLLKFILDKGLNPNGLDLFGLIEDEASGKLMFNIGKADFNTETQSICIDIRIPVSYDANDIISTLQQVCKEYKIEFEQIDFLRSIHVKKDSKLVSSLMNAYQDITQDFTSLPIASGGATYARAMDNCVAFGAVMPNSDKTAHQVNENISKSDIITAMEIYMKSFEILVLQEVK